MRVELARDPWRLCLQMPTWKPWYRRVNLVTCFLGVWILADDDDRAKFGDTV